MDPPLPVPQCESTTMHCVTSFPRTGSGLSGGGIAAVVLSIVVFVVILSVLVVYLRRRLRNAADDGMGVPLAMTEPKCEDTTMQLFGMAAEHAPDSQV